MATETRQQTVLLDDPAKPVPAEAALLRALEQAGVVECMDPACRIDGRRHLIQPRLGELEEARAGETPAARKVPAIVWEHGELEREPHFRRVMPLKVGLDASRSGATVTAGLEVEI